MCLSREYVETKDILQRPLIVGDRQLSRPLTLSLGMCGHRAEILLRIQQVLLTPGEMDHLNSSERGHFFLCSLEISFKANAQTLHLLIIYVILYIHIYIYTYIRICLSICIYIGFVLRVAIPTSRMVFFSPSLQIRCFQGWGA